jgi:hypothetical protein
MTMNAQPTAPAAPAAAPAPEAPAPSLEARADALKAKLSSPEAPSESAAETSSDGAAPALGQDDSSAAPSDGASPEIPPHILERQRRMREYAERERAADAEREQKRARHAKERETTTEIETLRAKLKDLEPLNDVFSDEAKLLAAAEAKGMSAEKLISWMRTRLSDPAAVAQREAKAAEDRTLAKIAELEKRLADSEKARQDAIEQAEAQRQGIERSNQFVHLTQTMTETHPRVAQFLQRRGPAALIQFANEHVAKYLPEEFDLPELHDKFETFLEAVAGGDIPAPAQSASGTSLPTKKNGAEQPVTTLSGALASERTTVAEEIPLSRLSLDERAERLKAKLARG